MDDRGNESTNTRAQGAGVADPKPTHTIERAKRMLDEGASPTLSAPDGLPDGSRHGGAGLQHRASGTEGGDRG